MTAQQLSRRFEAALQGNEHYQAYTERLGKAPYKLIRCSAILKEAAALHAARDTRSLSTADLTGRFVPKMAKASLQLGAHRSRLSELKAGVSKVEFLLADYLDILTHTLRTDLRGPLARDFSTEKLRDSALKSALQEGWSLLARYKSTRSILDEYIKDIDQGYWTLKLITDVFAQSRVEGFRQ